MSDREAVYVLDEILSNATTLAHLVPGTDEHVNQYGTTTFPIEKVLARQGFRPLRAPEAMIPVLD